MNKCVITGCIKLDEKANRICEDIDVRGVQEQLYADLTDRKNAAYRKKFWEDQQIAYMQTETYANIVNPIVVCRGVMRETLDAVPEFRQSYIANIAMVIYDKLGECCVDECNDIAELILQKVFYDE
jgi:hypothetical protein